MINSSFPSTPTMLNKLPSLVAAMKDVQKQFNFRCELDAESVIGKPGPIATDKLAGKLLNPRHPRGMARVRKFS